MSDPLALRVRDLSVRYGGIVAVDCVSVDVPADGITGLIGPNGAGKTSFFNACAGLVRAASGTVELFGTDVSGKGVASRASAGIGRTFQIVQLFRTMTVRENVAAGVEAALLRRRPQSLFVTTRAERRQVQDRTDEVIELCRLGPLERRIAGALATGEQRMVELARVLASPARVLLLDEPSSGLSEADRAHFAEVLLNATRTLGRAGFVVEHDMDLVAKICRDVYVLNFGKLIFSGSMREALASEAVQRSYIGGGADSPASASEEVTNA